jgi:hypothetical protein
MPVQRDTTYKEIVANGTYLLKTGAGFLNRIVVNAPGGGSIQIADALTNVAPYIAGATAFALPAAGSTLNYQVNYYTGLTIVITGMTSGSITVSFG